MQPEIAKKRWRVAAAIIDMVVAFAVLTIIGVIFGDAIIGSAEPGNFSVHLQGTSFAVGVVVVLLAFALLEFKFGKTPGKFVCGTRVVNEADLGPISLMQALIRNALRLIDGLFLYLVGFIIIAFDKKRQRLGDLVAKTVVVKG